MDEKLKRLRRSLTFLNAVVGGIILLVLLCVTLIFVNRQFRSNVRNSFVYAAETIANTLNDGANIAHSYLRSVELEQDMIIHIEDNGTPLLWKGSYPARTPRGELLSLARTLARENSMPLDYAPISPRSFDSVISGNHGDRYRLSVWVFPDDANFFTVFLLKDMREENARVLATCLVFLLAALIGIAIQSAFSYYFSGRVIRPIEKSERNQRTFIQSASHELRTPLAVISASAEAIPLADGEEVFAFSNSIREQSRQMARLVDDLLLLASVDAQSLSLHCGSVETAALLSDVVTAFRPLMAEKCVSFQADNVCDAVVWADEARIKQVLYVLLDNAIEYATAGGMVRLSCAEHGGNVEMIVEDNGPGIPDADKENVFDRFYRADKARGHKKSHYGLGLCVACEIVRAHGGSLTVHDSPLGGAKFLVRIPNGHGNSN